MIVPVLVSCASLARAQSPLTGGTRPKPVTSIPPPRQFRPDDIEVRRIRSAPSASDLQGPNAASAGSSTSSGPSRDSTLSGSIPTAAPLPFSSRQPDASGEPSVPPPPPAHFTVDTTL